MSARFAFKAKVWLFTNAPTAWHFVSAPKAMSAEIRSLSAGMRNAFGTLRIVATIGSSTWRTSVFYDTKQEAFLLPLKAAVRRKEKIIDGDTVSVTLEIDL